MTWSIGEVVQPNVQGTFHSDVQAASYFDPEQNLRLAKSYIFTSSEKGNQLGSIELLWRLCEAHLPSTTPNRFVIVATYGHGKSHFAVAVANYFGQPVDSEEFQAVLGQLEHADNDRSWRRRFEDFREARKPSLVVLLRGDEPQDLPTKFFQGLETSLKHHEAARDVQLPFWFDEAEGFLRRTLESQAVAADRFLQVWDLDLLTLLDQVTRRQASAYDACRELFRELHGVYPQFEGTTSLGDMVKWVADNLCGEGRPFDGLLILFDEFSTFVHEYASGHRSGAGAPLQDLLNGVRDRRGKVAFVGLAQHDPRTVAEQARSSESQVTSVLRELDRLEGRYELKAVLEEVLASYLKQDEELWRLALGDQSFREQIDRANDLTRRLFGRRYDEDLEWLPKRFRVVVTEGTFPLHPATTALFSSIVFRATAQPRSVLQFAFQSLAQRASEPMTIDGRVNWALPTELVDYFQEMLSDRHWPDYQHALATLGPDADPSLRTVLKAVLLLLAGEVQTKMVGTPRAIAEFCGLDVATVEHALNDLVRRYVLRHDVADNRYTFWGSQGPAQVEQPLRKKLDELTFTLPAAQMVLEQLQEVGELLPIAVPVGWGAPQDWEATQVLLSREHLMEGDLLELAKTIVAKPDDPRRPRGLVCWLLADNESDVAWYRDEAPRLLDRTLQQIDFPGLPVLLMRPRLPSTEAVITARRIHGLLTFDNAEKHDVGLNAYETLRSSEVEQLARLMRNAASTSVPIVPEPFRAMQSLERPGGVEPILREMFGQAFERRPREFNTQYRLSNRQWSTGVVLVASHLAADDLLQHVGSLRRANAPGADLVEKYLASNGKWRLLNQRQAIQTPPAESPVWHAWQHLDQQIARGAKGVSLRSVMATLLNPPFGYDTHTFLVVFAAWYGYHRHELQLSVAGKLRPLDKAMQDPRSGSLLRLADIIALLGGATLTRTNPSETDEKVRLILERANHEQAVSPQEAERDIATLEQALRNPRIDTDRALVLRTAQARLQADLDQAAEYSAKVRALKGLAPDANRIGDVLESLAALNELGDLPRLVAVEEPAPAEISARLRARAERLAKQLCERYETLATVGEYEVNRQRLLQLQRLLRQHGLQGLLPRVAQALQSLDTARDRLEAAESAKRHDQGIQAELRGMHVGEDTTLALARTYLVRLDSLQPKTESVREEVKAKRAGVLRVVNDLTDFVSTLETRVDEAATPDAIRAVHNDVLSRRLLFANAEEAATLEQVLQRCDALETLFDEVERLSQMSIESPADADELSRRIAELVASSDIRISPVQRGTIEAAALRLDEQVTAKTQAAMRWLSDRERELDDGGDLFGLRDRLRQPQAFLPADEQPRLEKLRVRVQAALEQDAERQVEYYFRLITDSTKQEALLDRLHRLIGDLTRS